MKGRIMSQYIIAVARPHLIVRDGESSCCHAREFRGTLAMLS